MKIFTKFLSLAALSVGFTTSSLQAQTLGDVMRTEGIDKMLGTWVDADTNGEKFKITYRWKIKDHAVELNLKTPDSTSTALIMLDQSSDEVVHVGVNSKGEVGRGTWSTEDGAAVLDLTQSNAAGEDIELRIFHKPVDKKSLTVGFEMKATGDTGEITLVRPAKKPKAKKEKGKAKNKDAGSE